MAKNSNKLGALRKRIFATDSAILSALSKRMMIVHEIGSIKRTVGMEPFDPQLRNKRLKTWIARGKRLGLSQTFIKDIYKVVHDHSVSIEKKAR